jgi:ATP-binding protein involved in chromosome partitioning
MTLFETNPEHPHKNTNGPLNRVVQEAMAALIIAAQQEDSGLQTLSHSELRAKVLGIGASSDGRPQIRIDSNLLTINQKLSIERTLLRHFGNQELPDVAVYFQKASSAAAKPTEPAPLKKKNPLGLTIDTKPIPGVKAIIAVASGKGGVGKSTVATNLAAGLARLGLKAGLMDCDVYGPSSPTMLGVSGPLPIESSMLVPLERHGVKVVSFGFLTDTKTPVIWRGPLVSKAIEQLCYDVKWGSLDALVLDLPPGTGDVQMTLAEKLPITGSIIVTTPQDIALIDAHKAVSMFEKLGVPMWGVVENMTHHTCSACGHQDDIFGRESFDQFAAARALKTLSRIPIERTIRLQSDAGSPVVLSDHPAANPYRELAEAIYAKLLA